MFYFWIMDPTPKIINNQVIIKFNFVPLVLSWFLVASSSFSSSSSPKKKILDNSYFSPEHKFVSGKTVEYLSDPIFYDTYIPIIYKIPIPMHTDIALRLNWGDVHNCTKPNGGKYCPIGYHLFKVIGKLDDDMGFWIPYYKNQTKSGKKESMKKRLGYEVICNEISSHFFRSYTSKYQMDTYVTALKACSRHDLGQHQVPIFEPKESWVVDKTVYYKMLDSFKATYFSNLPTKGGVDWAISLNTYASVHGLLLTNHVMESVRLSTALRICQQGLIPETFVSMDMLRTSIRNVSQNLHKWGYQLVYNDLVQDLEEYYKLPLADCTFSDEYSFYVRILIPIKRSDLYHRLLEINTIPFLEKLPETDGLPERLCRLKLPASKLTLIETSTGLLLDTTCEPDKLCKTSEVLTVFENDACTTSLLSDDPKLISNACKFSCFSVDPVTLPIIRRINSDTYVAVGGKDVRIHLNCFDKPKELVPIQLKNLGAVRIKLACNCQLLYLNHVSYRPRDPCGGKTVVEHILPYHWYSQMLRNETNVVERGTDKESTIEPHASTIITTTSPTLTPNASEEFESEKNTTPSANTEFESVGDDTTPQYMVDLDDKQIEKSIEAQEEELENKFRPSKIKNGEGFVGCSHLSISGVMMFHLCVLWILVVILGTATVYMGYHLRNLMKWRELQAYKDTRIVYRIPSDTPDNENKKIRGGSSGEVRVAWDAFYDLFNVH